MSAFTIAIVGRPNVGKSTLFNRLVGKRLALVADTPGVTRDRRRADGSISNLKFSVFDTAGLENTVRGSLEERMRAHTELAIQEADLCLFLIDARTGITPFDTLSAATLRKSGKPVILIANKSESRVAESGYYESFSLGLGEPCPISAEHGEGFGELYTAIVNTIGMERAFISHRNQEKTKRTTTIPISLGNEGCDPRKENANLSKPLRIAIVGRPNTGKSTLINQMTHQQRLLTGPEAGITRDSISVEWQWNGRDILLFDTAGMRRRAKIHEKLEKLSVSDGLRAVQFAEVVIVLFDAVNAFEKQDLQISDLMIREGRAPVIVVNKWDLVDDRQAMLAQLLEKGERLLPQVKGLKIIPISAKTGKGIDMVMETVFTVYDVWNQRIATAALNRWLADVQIHHPPPMVANRRIRLKYITQVKTRPPTFMIACSRPEALPASYSRYLVNGLYERFKLYGSPIRLYLRKGNNPYRGTVRK